MPPGQSKQRSEPRIRSSWAASADATTNLQITVQSDVDVVRFSSLGGTSLVRVHHGCIFYSPGHNFS